MSIAKRIVIALAVIISCIGCDQWSKVIANESLAPFAVRSYVSDTFRLELAHNKGAFLNLGESLSESMRTALLSIGVGGLLAALLVYALLARAISPIQLFAIALMIGGGASNLIDRLRDGGVVTDFLNVGIGPLRTGIFNVADMAITVGVLLLLLSGMATKKSAGSS